MCSSMRNRREEPSLVVKETSSKKARSVFGCQTPTPKTTRKTASWATFLPTCGQTLVTTSNNEILQRANIRRSLVWLKSTSQSGHVAGFTVNQTPPLDQGDGWDSLESAREHPLATTLTTGHRRHEERAQRQPCEPDHPRIPKVR